MILISPPLQKQDESSSNTITTTKTIQIEVRGKEYAQIVTINKASIDLGKEEPLEFVITNTGNSPLKNMIVSWKDPKGVILPVYSDNTKYIKYLAAQSIRNSRLLCNGRRERRSGALYS